MDKEQLINDLNMLFDSFIESKGIDLENTKITTNRFNAIMMYLYNSYVYKLEIVNNRFKQYSYIDFCNLIEWYISKCLYLDIISIYGFCLLINKSMEWLNSLKYMTPEELTKSFVIDIYNINTKNKDYINSKEKCSIENDIINNPDVVLNTMCDSIDNNINSSQKLRDEVMENASLLLFDSIKKLYETLTQSTVNKLNDSQLGLIANANNNKDIGLNYAKERIEAQVKAKQSISLADLPLLE